MGDVNDEIYPMIDADPFEPLSLKAYKTQTSTIPMFTIYFDGHVEFGPDYDPDEASLLFWRGISEYRESNAELIEKLLEAETQIEINRMQRNDLEAEIADLKQWRDRDKWGYI